MWSAHADQNGFIRFAIGMLAWAPEARIVHGGPAAKQALAEALRHRYISAKSRRGG
ncbi:MBL fold metallo-hydrolase RNA specificity domain-containing protein [Pseudomonas sp. B1-22]|uniref:MBL fold metallo-hydrolase RNA specificity domain-containing protein n=1 Tax=Pseudomonas sp. B1-22 TaxID=3141456 RepID=UPI003D2E77CB